MLLFLLRNPGRLVKKDEIVNTVWEGYSVSDNSLTRSVATLRRLLGDDAREPRYIATAQTIGYRFLCPVEVSDGGLNQPETAASPVTPDEQNSSIPDERRAKWVLAAMGTAVVVAAAWFGYGLAKSYDVVARLRNSTVKRSAAAPVRVVQLTNLTGNVSWPAFSPDGRQIAFVWDPGDHASGGDLYVQFVDGDSPPLRLTHSRSAFVTPPTWTPDGREVAFGRCDDNGGSIYTESALGGPEHRITDVACPFGYVPPFSLTSDGRSLVLADRCVPDGPVSIVVFSMETGAKHCLVALSKGEDLGDSGPVLSPVGQTVAFVKFRTGGNSPGDL